MFLAIVIALFLYFTGIVFLMPLLHRKKMRISLAVAFIYVLTGVFILVSGAEYAFCFVPLLFVITIGFLLLTISAVDSLSKTF